MSRLRRLGRPDAVTLLVVALAVVALALRLYDLGGRAMHHDESLHATYAWYLSVGRGYFHDPLMHGPLQFHLIAGLFRLLGDTEAVSRLPSAFAGTALVLTPLLLRRWLGGPGTVVAALLLTISPSLLYFSRFARNDLLMALWAVLMVTAVWRYREHGGWGWLLLLATTLALSFATKETAYITVAMLLLYLNATLTLVLLARRETGGLRRVVRGVAIFPFAWLIAAAWRPAGGWLKLGPRPREADLLLVLGTLTLPFLAALVRIPWEAVDGPLSADREYTVGLALVLALFAGSALVGVAWSWSRWLPLMAVVLAVTLPLYTAGFTNLDGAGGAFWSSLDYWLDQQAVQRGTQPGFYYLMMVPLYEFLALIPAAGGLWLLRRGDRLTALLVWWFAASFLALSLAGEKMPWLTVHLALPLALLAARAVGAACATIWNGIQGEYGFFAWAGAAAVLMVGAVVLGGSLRSTTAVVFTHPDTPVEPLIYTQTSPQVPALMAQIEALRAQSAVPLTVTVDSTSSFSWPWAWYLRDYPSVFYADPEFIVANVPTDGILIAASSTLNANPGLRGQFDRGEDYRHRWWFPEAGYRAITPAALFSGIVDGSLLADWREFYVNRIDESAIGSIDGVVLFPAAATP